MYDSTNVIPYKDAAVITNIGLDHTALLGKTKSEIAKRKAGIITGQTHVYTSESSPNIRKIIKDQASKTNSPFYVTQSNKLAHINVNQNGTLFTYEEIAYKTSAIGTHQAVNAALAIDVATALGIKQPAIQKGIARAKQPLRMEIISNNPLIILDGAHNPDKIASTVTTLTHIVQNKRLHIINGYSANKDVTHMVEHLSTLKPISVACTRNTINHFRTVTSPSTLAALWRDVSPEATIEQFLDPRIALAWTLQHAKKNDAILITGSLFVASEIQALL